MIARRPNVSWIGDHSSGGLTLYTADHLGQSIEPGIELGHGIPSHEAHALAAELETLLDRIVQAQRNYSRDALTDDEGGS